MPPASRQRGKPGEAPGIHVELSDLMPDEATKPYSYTLDYGDGVAPVDGSSSDDPFSFSYTYANAGTYTVIFEAWNCAMIQPVGAVFERARRQRAGRLRACNHRTAVGSHIHVGISGCGHWRWPHW